jgi:arsenite methyltransferase
MTNESHIIDHVRSRYGAIAGSSLSSDDPGVASIAHAFGYTPEELESLPSAANMGLSCGNPVATAHLRAGETVVDLGCGGGLDVMLAAQKVGPMGKAIGIDMTPEMMERARKNAVQFGKGTAPANVEFHLARIEKLPLADNTVDCLISNCVINLAPDKSAVFHEMHRVLKPGGRVAVSDIALKQPLPDELSQDIMAYVGCIAGAILIPDYVRLLHEAGFTSVQVIDTQKDLNAYAKAETSGCCTAPTQTISCCGPTAGTVAAVEEKPQVSCCGAPDESAEDGAAFHDGLTDLLRRYNANDYAASVQVYALKNS